MADGSQRLERLADLGIRCLRQANQVSGQAHLGQAVLRTGRGSGSSTGVSPTIKFTPCNLQLIGPFCV